MFNSDYYSTLSALSPYFIEIAVFILIAVTAYYCQKTFGIFADQSDGADNNNTFKDKDGRIIWIDLAKGICMLLVISGHTLYINPKTYVEHIVLGVIDSFHMPLFMILSCLTYKLSADNNQLVCKLEKAFKHLIFPLIIIYLFKTFSDCLLTLNDLKIDDLRNNINTLIYCSNIDVTLNGCKIKGLSYIWFFIVLFGGRSLFDYLHLKLKTKKRVLLYVTAACSITGFLLSKIQWLPFSFDISLAVMPFFLFGFYLQKGNLYTKRFTGGLASIILYLCGFAVIHHLIGADKFGVYLNLASRVYTYFPLCFLVAIAGSMIIIYSCQIIVSLHLAPPLLVFLGKHSMCLFLVHYMDYMYKFIWLYSDNCIINILLRICVNILLCILFVKTIELIGKRNQSASQ